MSLKQQAEVVDIVKAARTLKRLVSGVLARVQEEKGQACFVKSVKKRICVDEIRAFDEDVRIELVKSWFTSGAFWRSVNDYSRASKVDRASSVERCVEREQTVYGDREPGAQRKILKSFVPIRLIKNERKKSGLGKCLGCFVVRQSEKGESPSLYFCSTWIVRRLWMKRMNL